MEKEIQRKNNALVYDKNQLILFGFDFTINKNIMLILNVLNNQTREVAMASDIQFPDYGQALYLNDQNVFICGGRIRKGNNMEITKNTFSINLKNLKFS